MQGATGLELPSSRGRERTFILPAGAYALCPAGTGSGSAHVSVFSAAGSGERTQVFAFPVHRGQRGSLDLNGAGAQGVLRFGGHAYRASSGLALVPRASPRALRRGKPSVVVIRATDSLGRALGGALVVAKEGSRLIAGSLTGRSGIARLGIPGLARGTLAVSASAPG